MKLRVRRDAQKGHRVDHELIGPGEVLPGDYEDVPHLMQWKLEPVGEAAQRGDTPGQIEPDYQTKISAAPVPDLAKGELDTEETEARRGVQVRGKPQPGVDALSGRRGAAGGGAEEADDDRPGWYSDLRDKLGYEPTRDDLVNYGDSKGVDVRGKRKDDMISDIDARS